MKIKNSQKGSIKNCFENEHISLYTIVNERDAGQEVRGVLRKGWVNFYFCMEGEVDFSFGQQKSHRLQRQVSFYFFHNTEAPLFSTCTLVPGAKMVVLIISLLGLHKLFAYKDTSHLFSRQVRLYDERVLSGSILMVLNQLFYSPVANNAASLYFQGKALELMSLYFSAPSTETIENCPFLNTDEDVRKLKNAHTYLMKNICSPPSIRKLAKIAGFNEYQLKVGFKQYYGQTVHNYITDHRMEHARHLLNTKPFQVNQIADQLGYKNTSHFIAAFKKKYGITPKQYIIRNKLDK